MTDLPRLIKSSAIFLLFAATAIAGTEHRQSNLTVEVRSLSGEFVEGATVTVEMLNHDFRFGTAITAGQIEPGNPQYDAWTDTEVDKYFNSITFGNILKWSYYEDRTEERMLEIVGLAKVHKGFGSSDEMRVRGHVTIWGASYQIPSDVRNSNDSDYIHGRIIDHIYDYHTTFKDSGIRNFDLYNEHFHVPELLLDKVVPGKELELQAAEVAEWFNTAKSADPDAVLYINEYNILNFWSENDSDVKEYKAFVDAVRDEGGQVDGIGLQAHMDRMITKDQITRRLDILAAPMAPTSNYPDGLPGLRLEITELDINLSWDPTPEEQAIVTANVLEGAFEHPAVEGVTIWGMNDFDHWRDNSIMFDDLDEATGLRIDPVLKLSGQVWVDRVMTDWWTDEAGTSDSSGDFTASVFKGKYKITVTYDGITQEFIQDITEATTVIASFKAFVQDSTSYSEWESYIDWEQVSHSEKTADPDGDGRDNWTEYISGSDPLFKDDPTIIDLRREVSGNAYIYFTQRTGNEDIAVSIEYSEDLSAWSSYPDEVFSDPVPQLVFEEISNVNGRTTYKVQVLLSGLYRLNFIEISP